MIETIIAWGIANGFNDAAMLQMVGAAISLVLAVAIYLHQRGQVGPDLTERLRRIDRFWKEKFQPKPNAHTPPTEPEQPIRPIAKETKPRDPRDITDGII